jgi:hypothetical protein
MGWAVTRQASLTLALAIATVTCASSGISGRAASQDKDRHMVDAWLNNVLESAPVKVKPQKVAPIDDEHVRKVFPKGRFYDISFATWPVAPRLPKPLAYEMLARVGDGDSVEPIRDQESLKTFLTKELTDIRDEGAAAGAALASLRLAEAIATAGSYAFDKPEVSTVREGNNIVATARAGVQEPARGDVEIHLEFGSDGRVKPDAIKIDDRSRRGPPGGR